MLPDVELIVLLGAKLMSMEKKKTTESLSMQQTKNLKSQDICGTL